MHRHTILCYSDVVPAKRFNHSICGSSSSDKYKKEEYSDYFSVIGMNHVYS